jgi:hypothetical protein
MSEKSDQKSGPSQRQPHVPKPLDASTPAKRHQRCGKDIHFSNSEDPFIGTNSTGPKAKIAETEKPKK